MLMDIFTPTQPKEIECGGKQDALLEMIALGWIQIVTGTITLEVKSPF